MNPKTYSRQTKRLYLVKSTIVRLFLMAHDNQGGHTDTGESVISGIQKMRYRILVIDDNDKFRKAFCFKLGRVFGATVDNEGSGEAAIERLRHYSYDFIISDIMMPPGISGIETYHEIRKTDTVTRVVMMSAYSDSEEWQQAQKLQGVTLLHKPFSDAALIEIFDPNRGG